MDPSHDDGFPDLRDVDVLLGEAAALADACREGIDGDGLGRAYETALSIMLELRVPRMPESDDEWADVLRDAMDGPTFSSEEVYASLKAHGDRFERSLKAFRHAVGIHDWTTAEALLIGRHGEPLISWNDHTAEIAADQHRTTLVLKDGDGGCTTHVVEGTPSASTALAAMLTAHLECSAIWRR
jgi:hypothetical protein